MDPCDGGEQGLFPCDIGCAGEGVGLTSSEETSWRGDGGPNINCDYWHWMMCVAKWKLPSISKRRHSEKSQNDYLQEHRNIDAL